MDINGFNSVSNNIATSYVKPADSSAEKTSDSKDTSESKSTASQFSDVAATYEKSTEDKVTSKSSSKGDRSALIAQLKAEQDKIKNNLFDIVRQTISGQGNSFFLASEDDYWHALATGNFKATPEQIAQAKEDISEDGYWGVEKTSDRIVDFAIALSGNDTSKAELLINAFKKGYEQATGAWGQKLPDISSKTYDKVMEKFDSWKNGNYKSEQTTENATTAASTTE